MSTGDFICCRRYRTRVQQRSGAKLLEVKGIFPGAEVVQGPDWELEESESGKKYCKIGIIGTHTKQTPHEYRHLFGLQQPQPDCVYKHHTKIGTPHKKAPITVHTEVNC